ncbi:MAG: hypothetical protein IJK35_03525 [Oscillospiraceae bacterium]|nr:hypothetical protein [Oscillospiraceae bacterium]
MLYALPAWLRAALSFFGAGTLCHCFTPPVRRLALRLGAVDRPGGRRVNRRPDHGARDHPRYRRGLRSFGRRRRAERRIKR